MTRHGVILAGGKGTRLGELTKVANKHLLPVGPWPMIYYPLKKLTGVGITDIVLVSGAEDIGAFARILGSGSSFSCDITYKVQNEAGGVAQALGLADKACGGNSIVVVLGDNIFYDYVELGNPGRVMLSLSITLEPSRYGVAELDDGKMVSIEEKPAEPKSDLAVIGVYTYPPDVFDVIRNLKPSGRGELEITDVNNHYLQSGMLDWRMTCGYWVDAGTPESLALANTLVRQSPPRF